MDVRMARGLGWGLLASTLISFAGARGAHAVSDPSRVGFPSSDTTDGKFLSLPGKGMSALVVPTHLSLGVPSGAAASPLLVEIFDGDLGGAWDKPGGAVTTYELYTDASRDGSNMTPVASATDAAFADDAWSVLYGGPNVPAAMAPSGHYFYRLVVSIVGDAGVLNAYKVAIHGQGQICAIQNEFSFIGGVVQTGRAAGTAPYDQIVTTTDPTPTLDANNPNPLNTYDGKFAFKVFVGTAGASVSIQEGDADHVTDATAAVASEAALASQPGVAADGADGNVLGGLNVDYRPFRVGGAIKYVVKAPNGATLATVNDPSGNGEYETLPKFDTTQTGYYRMEWSDVDMRNTVFLKPAFGVEIFSADSAPVGAPLSTGLGGMRGTFFHDRNGDGVQQPTEAGLPGMPVTVTNLDTLVTTQVLTNAYGEYAASLPAGSYVAQPAAGSAPSDVLDTTIAGPTPVLAVVNGQTKSAATSGFTDPTGADASLALVPECRGRLTHIGLDVELPADLTGKFIQVQYTRAGTQSLYDAVSFVFNGRFSQPVIGYSRNLRVVNVYVDAGTTHVVVDTTISSRGFVRRELRAGDVEVLTGPADSDSGLLRPICRPAYLKQGQVVGGESTVKSLR